MLHSKPFLSVYFNGRSSSPHQSLPSHQLIRNNSEIMNPDIRLACTVPRLGKMCD
ncbi:hypothetical protein RchiOBHm_Chr2g0116471 [Rosa chinensis]|uniref:Uncharacterized protein n=1 Tax=Rosa chinensis TaxID=74649 RepID=A0A2P6RR95_ROSCH|nr:hypothetical protein RchiOBHm_Chr2g0116471 [Rosa chinensis]